MIDNRMTSIGLFAGGFGLDLGLEQAGFSTIGVVEHDPHAAKTILVNRPHLAMSAVPRDIQEIASKTLLEEGGRILDLGRDLRSGEVDLISGGPPCQPFSTAGRRGAFGDPRGSLFMDFIRIVRDIQPRYFIMENVRGLLSAAIQHRPIAERGEQAQILNPDEEQGSALQVILKEMADSGYTVRFKLLNAADYGVPQTRWRVVFLGSRDGEALAFPKETHSERGTLGREAWQTLRSALKGLHDPEPEFYAYPESRLRFLKLLTEGQYWRHLPDDLKAEAMGGAYLSGGGKVGFYRRLAWDKPSPTVTTAPHQKATDMCHPTELRPLSVREYARIQTFPDEWCFTGPTSAKYRQIGNAVPVGLSRALGKHIAEAVNGKLLAGHFATEQLSLFAH
jgi:DNA (cytosine-5)-methyltransferase 1